MIEHESPVEPRMPLPRMVMPIIALSLILFVGGLLLALGLCMVTRNFFSGLVLLARMWINGRFLRWRQLSSRIAEDGSGTLIIESPLLGCPLTHAWWTPEKVLVVCPFAPPTDEDYRNLPDNPIECHGWDGWQWENYTDPNKGRAFLLRVRDGRSLEERVRHAFPSIDVVHTWTALVHLAKPAAAPAAAPGAA